VEAALVTAFSVVVRSGVTAPTMESTTSGARWESSTEAGHASDAEAAAQAAHTDAAVAQAHVVIAGNAAAGAATFKADALGAANAASLDQLLAGAWAEYLDGDNPIPAGFFAHTAVTGQHWSARYHAHKALMVQTVIEGSLSAAQDAATSAAQDAATVAGLAQQVASAADAVMQTAAPAQGLIDAVTNAADAANQAAVTANQAAASAAGLADSKVSRAGDSMTGPLVLSGAPTQADHAARKDYVDQAIGSATAPLATQAALTTGLAAKANASDLAPLATLAGVDASYVAKASVTAIGNSLLGAADAAAARSALGVMPTAGFRNVIINGDFSIYQRVSGATSNSSVFSIFVVDRWKVSSASLSGSNMHGALLAPIQFFSPDAPFNSSYYLHVQRDVAVTGNAGNTLSQTIEDVRTLSGETVTLSFWARAAGLGYSVPDVTLRSIRLIQDFGTNTLGGNASSSPVETVLSGPITIGSSWIRYTVTGQIPSVRGKTVGLDGNTYLNLMFDLPLNSVYEFDLACVQLEAGDTATEFERRPPGVELVMCQRYFWRIPQFTYFGFQGVVPAGPYVYLKEVIWHPVPMRAKPTAVLGNYLASSMLSNIMFLTPDPLFTPLMLGHGAVAATSAWTIALDGGATFDAEL
jgi:hypothetical protein